MGLLRSDFMAKKRSPSSFGGTPMSRYKKVKGGFQFIDVWSQKPSGTLFKTKKAALKAKQKYSDAVLAAFNANDKW